MERNSIFFLDFFQIGDNKIRNMMRRTTSYLYIYDKRNAQDMQFSTHETKKTTQCLCMGKCVELTVWSSHHYIFPKKK